MRRYTSKRDLAEIIRRQNERCARCPSPLVRGRYHIDHRIPVSPATGGKDTLANKQALCLDCHRKKTSGSGATTAGSDIGNIAKLKRFARGERLSRTPMSCGRNSRWKRRLTSQGPKTERRRA